MNKKDMAVLMHPWYYEESAPLLDIGTNEFLFAADSMPGIGESVTGLADLGPNGYDMSGGTATYSVVAAGGGKAISGNTGTPMSASGFAGRTFTTENWIYGVAFKRSAWMSAFYFGNATPGNDQYKHIYLDNGAGNVALYTNGTDPTSSNSIVSADTWYTAIVYCDTTEEEVTLYLDGVDVMVSGPISITSQDWDAGIVSLGRPDWGINGALAGAVLAYDVTPSDVATAHAELAALFAP